MIDLSTVPDDDGRLRALVYLVAAIRPAWDQPGIKACLHAARKPGRSLERLIVVATAAAFDPKAETPAAILHTQRWEAPEAAQLEQPKPPPVSATFCKKCRGWIVIGREVPEHKCGTHDQPNREYLEAKAAL